MKDLSRPASLGLFVLVLVCFLLPFARISCSGSETKGRVAMRTVETVVQASGYEVAFGKAIAASPPDSVSGGSLSGGRPRWNAEPARRDYLALAILAAALTGIGLALVKGRRGAFIRALYCEHCALLALALWGELALRVGQRGAQLTMLSGYWAMLASFAAAAAVNLAALRALQRASVAGSDARG